MANRLQKQVAASFLPAIQPVVGSPAYCTQVIVKGNAPVTPVGSSKPTTSIKLAGSNAASGLYVWNNDTKTIEAHPDRDSHYVSPPSVPDPAATWPDRVYEVCYPEVLAVAGRDATYNNLPNSGWNAGGASIRTVPGDAEFSFYIGRASSGVLCGLAPAGAPTGQFNAIAHGLLYVGLTVQVVEHGAIVVDSGVPLTSGLPLLISRIRGEVTYHVGTWEYTSPQTSRGDVGLYVVAYSAGDYIEDPSIATAHPLSVKSTWGWSDPAAARSIAARSTWSWAGSATAETADLTATLDLLFAASEDERSELRADPGGVEVSTESGAPVVDDAGVYAELGLLGAAVGNSIISGDLAVPLSLWGLSSEEEYGELVGEVASLVGGGYEGAEAPGSSSYLDRAFLRDEWVTEPILFAHIQDTLRVGSEFEVYLALDATIVDRLVVSDDTSVTGVFQAAIQAGLRFTDNTSLVRASLLQYATNLLTGAVTRYEGFDFRGFARVGMDTYGWKPEGVYRIGAPTDDGELITALVDLAAEDFGTASAKRMEAVFFGLSTDGQVFAKVTTDTGKEVTYRVRTRSQSTGRANIGQGRASRFWKLQLQVVDATFAELDNVEWVAGATGRRTTR